ncbi:PilN domain-containing protein [Chloroflexota bacterium]
MAKKIVTLYIDDISLRLMVTDGKRIKTWAESSLEPGLVNNNMVINEAQVATKIKQLLKALKVKTQKVMVGMSGLRCITRPITFPPLPLEMLDEAVRREATRVLPVPLEQLYIAWQTIPAPKEKTQVFLTAIPCQILDALFKTLHQASLKPIFIDIKPLLLARVVKKATAVIIDVQTTEFDIVIMADGVSQPIRTIPFASEELPSENKLTIIKKELDRTIAYYNSNNPENTLASSVPIFASGELADDLELCQILSDKIGNPVLPLSSPLVCPEGFTPSHYMNNIGLALQKVSGKEDSPSLINLNALPVCYRPKPISLINICAVPGFAIAILIIVFLIITIQTISADIASTRVQFNTTNQLLQQKLSKEQELTGNIAELQTQITGVEASRDDFTTAIGSLEKQNAEINLPLAVTIKGLPSTISLSSISCANKMLAINGQAPSEREVLSYLKQLETSGSFSEITIANMNRTEGEAMDFTLLGNIQTQGEDANSMVVVLGSLPTGISLTSVSSTNGTLIINGRSPDEDEVLLYLQTLETSGKFSEISISSTTNIEDGGISFSLVLQTEE